MQYLLFSTSSCKFSLQRETGRGNTCEFLAQTPLLVSFFSVWECRVTQRKDVTVTPGLCALWGDGARVDISPFLQLLGSLLQLLMGAPLIFGKLGDSYNVPMEVNQ